jgi:hypothetical protein
MIGFNSHRPHTLLKTDRSVVSLNAALRHYVPALKAALSRGVQAVPDPKRSGLYEIEIGGDWYYISVPKPNSSVYLIAARSLAHQAPIESEQAALAG